MEDKMGIGGVGDPGGPNDYGGAEFGGTASGLGVSEPGFSGDQAGQVGVDEGGAVGGGPADIPDKPPAPAPRRVPKPAKVAEKKDAVKRKARKRSLLNDEETTVYRRSILGS